jgi:hypothetical protein
MVSSVLKKSLMMSLVLTFLSSVGGAANSTTAPVKKVTAGKSQKALATNKTLEPMTGADATVANVLLEQLLNSVEKASVDFEVQGVIDSEKGFLPDTFKLTGLSEFNADWRAAIRVPKTGDEKNQKDSSSDQIEKLIPIMQMDSKSLVTSVNVDQTKDQTKMNLEFFAPYDKKKKKWNPRPLMVTISNQLNKALIKIKFNWVKVEIAKSADETQPSLVKGICSSEKSLLDFTTGLNISVPVYCEFEGTYSEAGYNIRFKYLNAKPSATPSSAPSAIPATPAKL